jgi:hypothetical protein
MEFLFSVPPFHIEPLCRAAYSECAIAPQNEVSMLDLMFIAIGLGFLAGAMLYAVACDRL